MKKNPPLPPGKKRCPQCWKVKLERFFIGREGQQTKNCTSCIKKRALWAKGQKPNLAARRRGLATAGDILVRVVRESKGEKLGGIPVTITTANTCPPSCGLYGKGCYAEFHLTRVWWRKAQTEGLEWEIFLRWVRELPEGTLWRHNLAGDLPGIGEVINIAKTAQLVLANSGRRGFTFTHKKLDDENVRSVIKAANELGFTINLSADSLTEADAKASLGIAPVCVVLPADAPAKLRTPDGRRVVVCPAQTHEKMTCAKCQLCARPQRSAIIGFRAHGQAQKTISRNVVQLRLKLAPSANGDSIKEAPP